MIRKNGLFGGVGKTLVGLAAAATMTFAAQVQAKDDIILGGSMPLTGVFGFAGQAADRAIQDYLALVNENGGVNGRQIRFVKEDTGYRVDASVAAFNRLTSSHNITLYSGDSTGFQKTINDELNRRGNILLAGASFGTDLNDPATYPYQIIPGPDYSQMFDILLQHIAEEKPGASVAFMYSDTEFGRDPIPRGKQIAADLGLKVVSEIVTPPGNVDVTRHVLQLRRDRPDYMIFQGYLLQPIPEFISQARQMGIKTQFMGTFWNMDTGIVGQMGEAGDGFMGVMPYNYMGSDEAKGPMIDYIMEKRGGPMPVYYTQAFFSTMLLVESVRRTLDAGKELNGTNMKEAFMSIQDFDTGGLVGVPVSTRGNSVPVGRVYRANAKTGQMEPVSDWINVE